jgi:PKD repeat protein
MKIKTSAFLLLGSLVFFSCNKEEMPSASFDVPGSVAKGSEVQFTNNSGNSKSYLWQFGDGQETTDKDPVHIYSTSGTYEVSLTAYSESKNLGDKVTAELTVFTPIPNASFTASDYDVNPGVSIIFNNRSTGAKYYLWRFGDGNTSTLGSPAHIYSNTGDYTVELTAFSDDSTKIDKYTRNVSVYTKDAFYDGFEPYSNFTQTIGFWSQYDFDDFQTFGFTEYDFTNEYYEGSFIIFDPDYTTPALTEAFATPQEGDQYAACFGAYEGLGDPAANDDWIVTPEIELGTGFELSFWAKSVLSSELVHDYIKIGISTDSYPYPPGDFTILETVGSPGVPSAWTEYTVDLSAYDGKTAKIGIHVYSIAGSFMFCMDDFFVGVPDTNKKLLQALRKKYERIITQENIVFSSEQE